MVVSHKQLGYFYAERVRVQFATVALILQFLIEMLGLLKVHRVFSDFPRCEGGPFRLGKFVVQDWLWPPSSEPGAILHQKLG
jgi:hypothetical protein